MYLLYADDSGVSSDPSVKYSVLAGFSTFENQTFWIQKAVDEIMLKHTGRADLELHASPIRSGKGIWRGFPTYSWLVCFRKMKKVSLIILLAFVCLAQLLAKDYPYLVYGEDGIYTYNIEDKKFCLKEFFKYKEKQRPYYRYFSDKDSVVMYDSEFDNYHCMFYRLNRQSHEFEEIYKIDRYNPYKECLVSVKDFIYMIERNLTKDTDSYWLTKRSFGSPDVIEKIELEIPDTEYYKKTGFKDEVVDECFLFKEHLIVPRFRWSNEYCILAKKTGRCLLSGKGKILFNRNSKSIFVLENERELYSIDMDDSGCAKKRVNTFVSEKEIILDITDYGDFCILKTGVWKTNFEPFTRIIFDHKRKLVTTEYYCSKKGDVLVNERKMNKLKN